MNTKDLWIRPYTRILNINFYKKQFGIDLSLNDLLIMEFYEDYFKVNCVHGQYYFVSKEIHENLNYPSILELKEFLGRKDLRHQKNVLYEQFIAYNKVLKKCDCFHRQRLI